MLKNTDIQEIYLPRIEQDWQKMQEQTPSFMEKVSASAKASAEKNIAKQLAEFETLAKSSEFNGKELENKLNQMLQQGSGSSFMASLDK
ncbi:MAG: hypothetical protein RSA20_09505, partial [Oscillospiraceae bacterium]